MRILMDAGKDPEGSPAKPASATGTGVAITALEAARAAGGRLLRGDPNAALARFSTDARRVRPGDFFVALQGPAEEAGTSVGEALRSGAVGAMVARPPAEWLAGPAGAGLPLEAVILQVEDTLRGLGDLARAWRERHGGRVVGVTGTNGKTTATEMLRAVLGAAGPVHASSGNLNDPAGVPLSILAWPAAASVAVLELGMSALGQIHRLCEIARPDVGVFTTIGEAHLESFGSVDGVARAASEMLPFLDRDRLAVINLDDAYVERFRTRAPGRTLTYGLTPRAEIWASDIVLQGPGGTRFTLRHRREAVSAWIPAPGRHNVSNALAAAAVGFAWGLPAAAIVAGLKAVRLPPMRMQPVRLASGARAINDAYNANPHSMERAMETFSALSNGARAIMVLGDMGQLGRHSEEMHRRIGVFAARSVPDLLIAVGPESRALAEAAVGAGLPAGRVVYCAEVGAAREQLRAALTPDTWVLVKASPEMRLDGVIEGL